ncbi:MAG: CheB methylesterase domain-containing protein, partial [Actinomycetota bacterium]
MTGHRLGLALEDAVTRQAVRDVCAMSGRSELVLSSITGSGLYARSHSVDLTHVVVGAMLPDATSTIEKFEALGGAEVLIVADNVVDAVQRLGVTPNRIIEAKGDPQAIAKQIVGALDRRGHVASPRPSSISSPPPSATNPAPATPRRPAPSISRRTLLAIGCSTGGPEALTQILSDFPANFPVPIVIVQHMPPDFTTVLAQTLNRATQLSVFEVTEPVVPKPGEVWIAPGHLHMETADPTGRLILHDGPEVKNCRPSVDVLFRSVAKTHGRLAVAAILTGMGDDGADGAVDLVDAGAHLIAQDEASSVVWGMPGAIVRKGLA